MSETQSADRRTSAGPRTPYAALSADLARAGLFDRRADYYALLLGGTGAAFAAGVWLFVDLGDSWWQLATAAGLAVVFAQFGLIGHDAGHGQLFGSRRANDVVGYLYADLLLGLGYGWWVGKHNAHHANPNHEDRDPDVDLGVIALTERQSTGRRGVVGFVVRHQAALFFPMLLLEGLDLHISTVRSLVCRQTRKPLLEIILLSLHAIVYLGAIFAVLSPGKALVFLAVHQGLFGLYLGCSFAPNHKGMPILSAAQALDPVRKQVLTSRNVRGNPVTDTVLGGLNYQIEHHLFPRMARPNLRRAQPMVRRFCADEGMPYTETTLVRSYAQTLRHLHTVTEPARRPPT